MYFLCFFIGSFSSVFLFLFYSGLFVLFHLTLFYYCSLDICLHFNERQKGYVFRWEGRRENLGGVEGGKTVIRIFCVKIKTCFQYKKNKIGKETMQTRLVKSHLGVLVSAWLKNKLN